jgi:hypothetical protein
MTTYEFKYGLKKAPAGAENGSGHVEHAIGILFREEGTGDPLLELPGHVNKSIWIPFSDLDVVMTMPHNNGTQRTAKNTAYKNLLVTHKTRPNIPVQTGWSLANLQTFADANDGAALSAATATNYIEVVLGQSYPVSFNL